MDFKQIVMDKADMAYRNMTTGATAAPLPKGISVLDTVQYHRKRDAFYHRLGQEKIAFMTAIREINIAREHRREILKLPRGQQKELEKALNYCNVYDAYVIDSGGFNLNFIKYKKYSEQYLRKLERKFGLQKDD